MNIDTHLDRAQADLAAAWAEANEKAVIVPIEQNEIPSWVSPTRTNAENHAEAYRKLINQKTRRR